MEEESLRLAKLVEYAVDEARKTPVYMLIEPDASSRTTSLSGFSLRRRLTRLIGTPPWLMLRWIVRLRSSR